MSYKFKHNVPVEIDYDSVKPQGFDFESRHSHAIINYSVELEVRDWGIKNILFLAYDQSVTFDLELLPADQEDSATYTFKIKLKGIETELPSNFSAGDICPETLCITITSLTAVGDDTFEGEGSATLSFSSASED